MTATIKPPFSEQTALAVVEASQDTWNERVAKEVPAAYSADTSWRYRETFLSGRDNILPFLLERWPVQQDYALRKHLWCFTGNRVSVRFESEWRHRDTQQWYRTHGNEHWQFDADGLISHLDLSANDIPIEESERRL